MRWLWWIVGYVVAMVVVVLAMIQSREWALAQLSTADSIADWQAWRQDVERHHDRPGPVQRRTPKSSEPPALVLMRDHFGTSLAGAVIFGSALYWVLAWFLMAIASNRKA